MKQADEEPEPRYTRRLSDQIATAFYEACKIGSLDAAKQLALALECEVARSTRPSSADKRQDGDDVAAVRARLALELRRNQG